MDEQDEFMDANDFMEPDVAEGAAITEMASGYWSNPDTFLDCLDVVDNVFEVSRCKPYALVWWMNDIQLRQLQDYVQNGADWLREMLIRTWTYCICRKFVPDTHNTSGACTELLKCRQSVGMSVSEYTQIFEQLWNRAEIKDTEQQKVCRYIQGLQWVIQYDLIIRPVTHMKEAIEIACRSEKLWKFTLETDVNIWDLRRNKGKNAAELLAPL